MNCNVRFVVLSGRSKSMWYCSWMVEVFSSWKMKEHENFPILPQRRDSKSGQSGRIASHWKLWSAENAVRLTWSHRSPVSSLLEATEGKEVGGHHRMQQRRKKQREENPNPPAHERKVFLPDFQPCFVLWISKWTIAATYTQGFLVVAYAYKSTHAITHW